MFVNDKSCLTAKGPFLTLHKLKGKALRGGSLKTIGREMLIASTISEASDTNLGTIGYKPTDPIHVKFTRIDTTIYLSQAVVPPVHDNERSPHVQGHRPEHPLPPIMHSYPLVCYNRDSSAMVIEMTKFFLGRQRTLLAPDQKHQGRRGEHHGQVQVRRFGDRPDQVLRGQRDRQSNLYLLLGDGRPAGPDGHQEGRADDREGHAHDPAAARRGDVAPSGRFRASASS